MPISRKDSNNEGFGVRVKQGLLFLGILLGFAQPAWAVAPYGLELGRYRALIIANQQYQQLTPLRTPHNDAEALATILRDEYSFKVTLLKDADRKTTLDALDNLVEKLTPRDNLLIFLCWSWSPRQGDG